MTGSAPPDLPVPRLVIWRHGRTGWNAAGRFQGQMDAPLDEQGRVQAARTAPYLVAAAGLSTDDAVVVASDLSRAADTASALTTLLGVELRQDPRLREHGMGCWEGLTRDEVAVRYPEQYADWLAGRPVRGRGGEEPAQVGERALAALAELPSARVAVVVTHGGTAGRLLERLLGLGPEHRRVFAPLANCAWSELAVQGPRWRVVSHNNAVPPLDAATATEVDGDGAGGRPASAAPEAAATPEGAGAPPLGDADAVL